MFLCVYVCVVYISVKLMSLGVLLRVSVRLKLAIKQIAYQRPDEGCLSSCSFPFYSTLSSICVHIFLILLPLQSHCAPLFSSLSFSLLLLLFFLTPRHPFAHLHNTPVFFPCHKKIFIFFFKLSFLFFRFIYYYFFFFFFFMRSNALLFFVFWTVTYYGTKPENDTNTHMYLCT